MCYQTWAVIKPWLHYCYESLFHFHHKVLAVCRSESLFNWHIPVINLLIELVRMFNCNLTLFLAFIYTYIIVIFWCLNICTWTFIRITACWINCFCNTFNLSHFWEKRDIQQKKTTWAERILLIWKWFHCVNLMLHTRMDPVLNASLQLTTETL